MAQLKSSEVGSSQVRVANTYTVLSISLVLFFVGILGMLIFFVNKIKKYAKENVIITVVINENVKSGSIERLRVELEALPEVKKAELIDEQTAKKILEESLGKDFLSIFDKNPLSASIELQLFEEHFDVDKIEYLKDKIEKKDKDLVKEVSYQKPLVENINQNISKIYLIVLSFTILMYLVSIGLINSTIRLTIHSKRIIIRTMRLIGATPEFIRKPFLVSGVYQGLISSLFAIILLFGVIIYIKREFESIIVLSEDWKEILFVVLGVIVIGVFLSYIAVFSATQRFLKSRTDDIFFK